MDSNDCGCDSGCGADVRVCLAVGVVEMGIIVVVGVVVMTWGWW